MSEILNKILDADLCHGCGGCASLAAVGAIKIIETDEGYRRPRAVADLPADFDCQLEASCSGLRIERQLGAGQYDVTWGPIVSCEVAYSTDAAIRFRGSSGGILSALAIHLIETNEVEFVVQTFADPDNPIGNRSGPSHNREDILSAAGSRYAPSSPLAYLEDYLSEGRRFALIGKPCDIATLRALARSDSRIDELIPYKLSFFCAGIPSSHGAKAVLAEMGANMEALVKFDFRGNGWPGLTRALMRDGEVCTLSYADAWGSVLSRHLQFRCKICPDGIGEQADIVAADAWYGRGGYPDFEERDGRSLVIARTREGRKLLDDCVVQEKIKTETLPISEIAHMQPYQRDRKRAVLPRLFAMMLVGRERPKYYGYKLVANSMRASPAWLTRNMLGMLRRLLKAH